MREFLNTRAVTWLRAGAFWTAVLLVVPNCSFDPSGLGFSSNLDKGSFPRNDLILCDIERPEGRHCSTEDERARGIRLSEAAIALAEGRTSDVALDDSEAALAECGGQPKAIYFQGPFPQGFPVCLDCATAIGTAEQPTVTVACRRQCYDLFGTVDGEGNIIPTVPPLPATVTFCDANSRPSTSFADNACFLGACDAGAVREDFIDPRSIPEPVVWTDLIGTTAGGAEGNNLSRTAPFTGAFDAGAVSTQWVTEGDAYLEFSASAANQSHLVGFTEIAAACPPPCTDTDPNFTSIDFTLGLGDDGRIRIFDLGSAQPGPDINSTFGTYAAGERFRVLLRDRGNGTAEVTFTRVVGTCVPGSPCTQTLLYTHSRTANYPLRIDTSLFELGATITDVRIVRIR